MDFGHVLKMLQPSLSTVNVQLHPNHPCLHAEGCCCALSLLTSQSRITENPKLEGTHRDHTEPNSWLHSGPSKNHTICLI